MESDDDENHYNSGDEYAYEDESDPEEYHDADDEQIVEMKTGEVRRSSNESGPRGKAVGLGKVPDGKFVITEYLEIIPLLDNVVKEVCALLEIDVDASQILLQCFRWDKERLIDAFFSDPDKVLSQAGLDLYASNIADKLQSAVSTATATATASSSIAATGIASASTFSCRICCDDVDQHASLSLGCEHKFCRPCYSEYLKNQVSEGPACICAHCPQHKCRQSVPRSFFVHLLDPSMADRYNMFVTRNFIETSKTMRYCPAAGCDKVAIGSGITTVRCSCSNPFCFRCGEEAHDPCSCTQLSEWATKCMNESETANWILANTKKCPKCNTRIEKNQGCNHMNCKLCKYEFCWICMGSWENHGQNTGGFYKCNRYDANKPNGSATAAQRAKAELDRYLHYYQRFHGHDSALKFASGQREAAERKMVERQEAHRSTWIDVQFLKNAAEQVIDCRRVLKYTYVLGYFLEDDSPEKQLFEHHQELLEKNTEKLHEYTEQSLEAIDRTQVVNLTRVTERFMASLLASMTGGVVDVSMGLSLSDGSVADASEVVDAGSSSASASATASFT